MIFLGIRKTTRAIAAKASLARVLVLFITITGLTGCAGFAHAQETSSMFAPVDPAQDLAQNWIDYIFKAQPLSSFYGRTYSDIEGSDAALPIGTQTGIQCALITGLGFYSNAMLIFAGFILFYHLVSMIANTAHEGIVMGKKANQVWVPIRLVVALGLLVPIGSGPVNCNQTTGAGLNSGQYIVIQMAEWGSGLASQVWNVFLGSLAKQYTYIAPPLPNMQQIVSDMALIEACRYSFNYDLWRSNKILSLGEQYIGGPFDPDNYTAPIGLMQLTGNDQIEYVYGNDVIDNYGLCGDYALKNPPVPASSGTPSLTDRVSASIVIAQNRAFADEQQDFADLGSKIRFIIDNGGQVPNNGSMPSNAIFQTVLTNYQDNLKRELDFALGNLIDNSMVTQIQQWSGQGWATAGAWLNTIAGIQGAIVSAGSSSLPITNPPFDNYLTAVFKQWEANGSGYAPVAPTLPVATPCNIGNTAQQDAAAAPAAALIKQDAPEESTAVAAAFNFIDTIGGDIPDAKTGIPGVGLWHFNNPCPGTNEHVFYLGNQLQTNNPLIELANWGHKAVLVAYSLIGGVPDKGHRQMAEALAKSEAKAMNKAGGMNIDRCADSMGGVDTQIGRNLCGKLYGAALNVGRFGNNVDQGVVAAKLYQLEMFNWVTSLISLCALIFFTCGFTLAFVVPLMPFFRFFFNVLTWIVSLLEAVIAIPLVALAHLNPEGEGLPGPSAKAAYFMIFNIFLRPVLMVFGLICGLLVFIIAIVFLNSTYSVAVAGTGAMLHGYATITRIVYTLMYSATVYVCANNCFKAIGYFPEHALRWIGTQGHHERMGDAGRAVQGVMGQAQGYMGQKAFDVAKIGNNGGGGV